MNDRDLADIETAAGILRRMIAEGDSGTSDAEEVARRIFVLAGRVYVAEGAARPVIVRANQTCFACPAQWDAWGADGSQYYLRYRHSFGSAERVRRGTDEWLDGDRRETVGEFETDETDGGVISLEEFCERAGLELRLA